MNEHAVKDLGNNYDNTVVITPVNIAEGCKISNSIIGPNVTIGEHTTIDSSIIKDSIIGSFAELEEVVLHSSIIGNDAFVRGLSQSLNIGDNTEIDLG
jgi:glucose-1-phosphate thymidylyltransferase